jgi:hypothetical protein
MKELPRSKLWGIEILESRRIPSAASCREYDPKRFNSLIQLPLFSGKKRETLRLKHAAALTEKPLPKREPTKNLQKGLISENFLAKLRKSAKVWH